MGLASILLHVKVWVEVIFHKVLSLLYRKDDHSFYLPPIKYDFLEYSASRLAEKIRKKELSSEEIVRAYINRIKEVNGLLNAVVSERFDEAIKEAKNVDEYLRTFTGDINDLKKTKPFLGLPFSTKESVECEGLNYTIGLVARKNVKGVEDADVVKLMKDAGGILMANTNIPELNLWYESRNMIYGQTNNPYNITRLSGGSTGGEGAILSASGACISIGTDIGGSIRIPSFYCGVFGHKPTKGVVSVKGVSKRTGKENTMVCGGPMTRHAEDLVPILKILTGSKSSMLKLDEEVNIKKVQIFYQDESKDASTNPLSKNMKKAFTRSVTYCQEATGKKAKKLNLEGFKYSFKIWKHWMTQEPYNFKRELGNCEKELSPISELFKKLVFQSEHSLAAVLKLSFDEYLPKVDKVWAESETEKLRHELLEHLGDNGVLIYPSFPESALYHFEAFVKFAELGYFGIFNVLGFPSTQVPCGLDENGLPVGIQVIAGPYNDHLCLAVARELEKSLGGWVPPYKK